MELGRSVTGRSGQGRGAVVVALAVAGAAALTGCGSSSRAAASAAGTPLQQGCAAVGAVLANGPDPGADPVGYAEAQILPLRSVTIGGSDLRRAVLDLSSAYERYFSTDGSRAATSAVARASAEVDAVCPGATS